MQIIQSHDDFIGPAIKQGTAGASGELAVLFVRVRAVVRWIGENRI
jgi:hypothetical protein